MDLDEPPEVVSVRLSVPEVERSSRAADRVGLALGLLELGLGDLIGVVPQVHDVPVSPGLRSVHLVDAPIWTLELDVSLEPLELTGSVCPTEGLCDQLRGVGGTWDDPTPAVSAVLLQIADALHRRPGPDEVASWNRIGSKDPYAVLMAGRSAAVVYGLRDVPEGQSAASDPVTRAFRVDPGMPLAAWMRGRRTDGAEAVVAFRRAAGARPESLVLRSDLGVSLVHPRVAQPVWAEVASRAPLDRRFAVPVATNRLELGHPEQASLLLDGLGLGSRHSPAVARLRVAIADATNVPDRVGLLEAWASADPLDAEPVRRLIRIQVERHAYEAGRELLAELGIRGAVDEAERLDVALLHALGRSEEAAELAERRGEGDLAAALRTPPDPNEASSRAGLPRLRAESSPR